MRAIVITGANDKYYTLLDGLVRSLRQHASLQSIDVGVYDFGLTEEQKTELTTGGAHVLDPGWDIEPPHVDRAPSYKKYVTAAPFAPRHFPGYDVYVWIDADAWVQTPEAVDMLIDGAKRSGMAACQEADRHYPSPLSGGRVQYWPLLGSAGPRRGVVTWQYKMFRRAYGRRFANETFFAPVINAGVYAIRADAPHWRCWEESMRLAPPADPSDLSDQIPLNHALHAHKLPIELLPARCNWLCSLRPPVFDPSRDLFVEPMAPHTPIGIIHLINKAKEPVSSVETLDGGSIAGGYTFHNRPRSQTVSA